MELEKMGEFFDSRLGIYDGHQLNCISSARVFYPFTAEALPLTPGCRVLDLGCGTGLELDEYFRLNPSADVTGIDLAPGMLSELRKKHPGKKLTLINKSYLGTDFGEGIYDAAVSVESIHHFTYGQKTGLYTALRKALRDGGYFILTDYFAENDAYEAARFAELAELKKTLGINDGELYHYDTPLTVEHETEALREAGFSEITILGRWEATACLRAIK